MASSDTAADVITQRKRDRLHKTKGNFVAYTGPENVDPARKLTPQQQNKKDREHVLGTRVSERCWARGEGCFDALGC